MKRKGSEEGRQKRARWPEQLPPYNGPGGSTFVFDSCERLWYILGIEGSEARVPARDLRGFVERCLAARGRG